MPLRLHCFLSPVGSLGGFAGCSSISSPLTLLEQQELPRTRPGSAHREAPINLGELDKLCTIPRPLRKTDVWEGNTGKPRRILREALARSRALYKQLVEAAHQKSSYVLWWPPLLFLRAATPPLQPWNLWKLPLEVSRTHPRACLDKLLKTHGKQCSPGQPDQHLANSCCQLWIGTSASPCQGTDQPLAPKEQFHIGSVCGLLKQHNLINLFIQWIISEK